MGDASRERLSDAGSIPARSIKRVAAVRQPFFGLAGSEPFSSIVNIYIKLADFSGDRINIIVVFFDPAEMTKSKNITDTSAQRPAEPAAAFLLI